MSWTTCFCLASVRRKTPLLAGGVAILLAAFTAAPVFADAEGSVGQDFFNLSAGTVNEGDSITASAQFNVSPASESGFAGTTTRTFNGNTLNVSAPGSVQGGSSPGAGGGSATQGFTTGPLTYTQNGTYNVSYNQSLSWHWQENASYGTGNPSGDSSGAVADLRTLTVLNVAPTATSLVLSNTTINEGQSIAAQVSATDPGADTVNFFVNGNGAGLDGNTTPGSTRTSNLVGLGPYYQTGPSPQVYAVTGQAQDSDGALSNLLTQSLTVLNLPPVIASINFNSFVQGPSGATVSFIGSASDPGLDTLSFAWDLDNDGLFDNDSSNPTSPLYYTPGHYKVNLLVSDGDGGTATQSFEFDIIPEPASVVMMGLGGLLAAAMFRRRKNRS